MDESNVLRVNLENLLEFRTTPDSHAGLALIRGYIDAGRDDELGRLLRHHRDGVVKGEEIKLRDQVDAWLSFVSTLELALLSGFVPANDAVAYAARFQGALCHPHVRVYHETHYKQLLPTSLRERLDGRHDIRYDGAWKYMLIFLSLEDQRQNDPALLLFMRLLDDFRSQGLVIADIAAVCKTPGLLGEALRHDPVAEPPACLKGLHGLERFLIFCANFRDLLQRTADEPILQSAFWQFHAYWFRKFKRKMGRHLETILDDLRANVGQDAPPELAALYRAQLDEYGETIRDLSSEIYDVPLRAIVAPGTAPTVVRPL